MIENVKVPQLVYEALNYYEKIWTKDQMLDFKHIQKHADDNSMLHSLDHYIRQFGPAEYARAVIVGYEAEKSVVEQLQDYYCSVPVHQQGPLNVVMKIIAKKHPEFEGIFD